MKMQQDDGPLFYYLFDGQGRHDGKTEIADMDECSELIAMAVKNRETVTITDSADNCVFRCERGKVAWPRLDSIFGKKDIDDYGQDLSGLH